jgi:RNase H-fold protein (predicted Holliday junction resolvase)
VVKKVDEEYSSVVADAKLEKYQKWPEEDTLAAMKILDWWIEQGAE